MKKKYFYTMLFSAACLTAAMTSCSLDETDYVDIEKNNYMNDASEAEIVLLGVYQAGISDGAYSMNLSFYLNMGTDCEQVEGSTTENWRIVPTNAYPTTQADIQDTWEALYTGIYRANDFLERLSVKMNSFESDDDKNLAAIYLAEARSLRALYYFELVRRFGNIPLMTSTAMADQHPSTFVQVDPVKVYEFIEADLKYAVETLPYATEDEYRSSNDFRFSKGAAMGLLAKVYATWAGYPVQDESKWEQAADIAGQLIKSGKHDLLADYEDLWYNTCNGIWDPTESLIEISFYSPTASASSDPVGRIGRWNGVRTSQIAGVRGRCAANEKVVHAFVLDWRDEDGIGVETDNTGTVTAYHYEPEAGTPGYDCRRPLSIANFQYDEDGKKLYARGSSDTDETAKNNDVDPNKRQKEKQNYTPGKWDIEKYVQPANSIINDDKSNVNWYVLRYADVLLLYAEALNEWKGGPTDEAYSAVNKVRRRAYNDTNHDLAPGMDQEAFREAVRKERKYELAFEGHRRMDLVRWGIYYETIQETYDKQMNWWPDANYVVYQYTEKGKHELCPIPQRDMDLCKQFKQNPKW